MTLILVVLFFNDPAPTETYTYRHPLSLHDARPIWAAVRRRISPDVPVTPGIFARGPALGEPRVLIRCVIGHEIKDQLETDRMRRGDQAIEIFERAEQRIDIAIIGYVIAEISHWRGIERRYPDRVNAERDEIAKPALDALQVANAVAIGIEERTGIDLQKGAPHPHTRVKDPTRT